MSSTFASAVAVIEKDINADLIPWIFPSLDPSLHPIIKSRCGLLDRDPDVLAQPHVTRYGNSWIYYKAQAISSVQNNKVNAISVVLVSQQYHPQKYWDLLTVFAKLYTEADSPVPIMKAYLSVFTTGKFEDYNVTTYDPRKALLANVKKTVNLFGHDTILIWIAMLLRKRVFVYHNKIHELCDLIRTFPLIGAWHRQNADLLRPFVRLNESEIGELQSSGVYVAGFTDPNAINRKELWDLYVDVPARTFSFSSSTSDDFALTKFHRHTADTFLKSSDDTDQVLIKAIALATKGLLDKVASLRTEQPDGTMLLTWDTLHKMNTLVETKLPAGMDKFIFAVALAEGMARQ